MEHSRPGKETHAHSPNSDIPSIPYKADKTPDMYGSDLTHATGWGTRATSFIQDLFPGLDFYCYGGPY